MQKMKKVLLGIMMVTMASQMMSTATYAAPASALAEPDFTITSEQVSDAPAVRASTQTGTIVASVNLRSKASSTGKVIRLLKKSETVSIVDKPSSSWYKVKDSKGNTGYISSSSKYVKVSGSSNGSTSGTTGGSTGGSINSGSTSSKIEKVIKTGYKYLGTPYEYGSNRNTTKTFDCSDFVRHVYKEALGITLPSDSRKQGTYIKSNSTAKKSISSLKRGDLMFFGKYRGSKASDYKNVNKSTERITHVGIYLGNGKILHTYSKESGGVREDVVTGKSWEHRFLYGGSVL